PICALFTDHCSVDLGLIWMNPSSVPIAVGQVFSDTTSSIFIKTSSVASDDSSAQVEIRFDFPPPTSTSCRHVPSLSITPLDSTDVRKRRFNISLTNNDENRDECVSNSVFSLDFSPPANTGKWKHSGLPLVFSLAPGQSNSDVVRIFPKDSAV